jgi:hypothetical protein
LKVTARRQIPGLNRTGVTATNQHPFGSIPTGETWWAAVNNCMKRTKRLWMGESDCLIEERASQNKAREDGNNCGHPCQESETR